MTAVPNLAVLALIEDPAVARAVELVVQAEGDTLRRVATVDEAVEVAAAQPIAVAFVELAAEGGAALALCHHLPALSSGTEVHALVTPRELERGGEALSLGASGVVVSPPTGDALLRVLSEAKSRAAQREQVSTLEMLLVRERKRLETYDRLVRFVRGSGQSDAVRAIVEGVAQLSGAKGVCLYATFSDQHTERVRLAALGTAVDLPSTSAPSELSVLVEARGARVVPLVVSGAELGILVLERAPAGPEAEVASLADLAAAMLSIVDRHDDVDENLQVFSPRSFRAVAERLLVLAARHDRRASVLAVAPPVEDRPVRHEAITTEISDVVRATDAVSGDEDGDLLLFLPETGGLGAHACRRRILARLSGDRRARGKGVPRSQEPGPASSPVCVGVATFPHDGRSLKRLVRTARARAVEDARSPVHTLGLEQRGLPEIVDALIARPILEAGPRSPFPLDVTSEALFALVSRACREGQRGGEVAVSTTLQPGLGVAAAARQTTSPRVHDVRATPGCEDLEVVVVEAEHGAWVCCGRVRGDRFQGVHAADPLLADVLVRRLTAAGGCHAG